MKWLGVRDGICNGVLNKPLVVQVTSDERAFSQRKASTEDRAGSVLLPPARDGRQAFADERARHDRTARHPGRTAMMSGAGPG